MSVPLALQPHHPQKLRDAPFHPVVRPFLHLTQMQRDVLPRRQVGEEGEVLKHHGTVRSKRVDEVLPAQGKIEDSAVAERNRPRIGLLKIVKAPQKGGFPRPRRTDDGDNLTRANVQVHAFENLERTERFFDAAYPDHASNAINFSATGGCWRLS